VTVNGTFAGGAGSVIAVTCPANPSCSWVTSGTGINAGDSLIWTSNAGSGGNAPLTLAFSAVYGAGFWLQADATGTYVASIQAFNSGGAIGSPLTETSDSNGDPIFIGVLDTLKEVTSIQVVLTSTGFGGNVDDFAVDTLKLKTLATTSTPEPSSFWLFSAVLPLLGWRGRKHLNRLSKGMMKI
jgi:hypothetical protein